MRSGIFNPFRLLPSQLYGLIPSVYPTTARHVRLQELPPGFTDSIHIVTHGHAAAAVVISAYASKVERFEF